MRLWTPRLRTVLLVVNVTIMLLPLGSVTFLRLYENEMIRQKEAALHAQGAYVSTLYRRELLAALGLRSDTFDAIGALTDYGLPVGPQWRHPANPALPYTPTVPSLQLQSTVVRQPHFGRAFFSDDPDPVSLKAGQALLPVILRAQALSMDSVRVVDSRGDVVASSFGEESRRLVLWEEVQRSLQGEYVSILRRKIPTKKTLTPLDSLGLGAPLTVEVAMPVVAHARVLGAVVLSGTPSQITEFVYGNKGQLLTALAVLMVVVTLLSVLSSLTISEPLQAVIRQIQLVAKGDPAAAKPIRWPMLRETRVLSEGVAQMAGVIAERAAYITGFARSVSHEFKTPLTAITGTTELLRDHLPEMSAEERRRFLDNLHADALRLSNLVRRLLDFARADVTSAGGERTPVDAVAGAVVERFRAGGLSVTLTAGAAGAAVGLSGELLESILTNLLDNARVHCPPGTHVAVVTERVRDEVELRVADDGPGISAANQAKAFQPFFTTARAQGGTGLGLSIVQSIVQARKGGVALASSAKGTTVTLRLPLA